MLRRIGMCIRPAAPYALHAPSVFGSHWNATRRPSSLSGMLMKSPLGGVVIRQRQSSVTTDTQ
jgi:hypothetical protein